MTQLSEALSGNTTKEMEYVSKVENIPLDFLRENIAKGRIIIPVNKFHTNVKPVGVGYKLKTKINANIGSSPNGSCIEEELSKVNLCIKYGADFIMDLSTGGDLDTIRKAIIQNCPVPIGTVPIYGAVQQVNAVEDLKPEDFLDEIEKQAKQGVDFMTIHSGVTQSTIELAKKRLAGVVSRGGSLLAKWMQYHKKENPLLTQFDEICDIFVKYDVAFSLGDGLRPGCIKDATDEAQLAELKKLGEQTKIAWEKDCQVMIEGPGHVPLHQIEKNVKLQQELCHNAPFYVLGPLVTDIGAGYDHITGAIGGAVAAMHGVSLLCYVTPSEHLGLPNLDDVRQGIIAFKIAAHAADIAKGLDVQGVDDEVSAARHNFDWEKHFKLSLDPDKAREIRIRDIPGKDLNFCSMCGSKFCSIKNFKEVKDNDKKE